MRYLIPLHFLFSAGGCVLAITLVLCSMIQYPAGAVLWDESLLIVCHGSVKQVKKMPYRQTKVPHGLHVVQENCPSHPFHLNVKCKQDKEV